MPPKKAMIAMSGGVDSSVAAYLMEQAGFDCCGATLLLCNESLLGKQDIPSPATDAKQVADRLGVSQVQVSRIEKKVLETLRKQCEKGD